MSRVCPSGAAFAPAALPTAPPAPERFSTTTVVFRMRGGASATGRAARSAWPPGGKGTIMLMLPLGQVPCPNTAGARAPVAAEATGRLASPFSRARRLWRGILVGTGILPYSLYDG